MTARGLSALLATGPAGAPTLPDMTVVELSLVIALLRDGAAGAERIAGTVAGWYARPVRSRDLAPSIARLTARGWLVAGSDGALSPTPRAHQPTSLLYACVIRMIGDAEREGNDGRQLHLIDLTSGETI